jgi:acetylornithine deacetylase/succinyl-diaminopimelate desuccinylase-like protein
VGRGGVAPASDRSCFSLCRFVNEKLACDIFGGGLDLKSGETYWEGQNLGRTKIAPTVLRRVGDKVVLNVNIRQNASLTRQDIEDAFRRFSGEYHYQFTIPVFLDAMRVSSKRKTLAVMAQTYEDWGYENRFIAAAGTSYAKAMKNIVTWGPCFPEDLSCAHQENERIGLRSLFRAMGIYTDYMHRVVSDPESYLER